jgi:hypothetical protein
MFAFHPYLDVLNGDASTPAAKLASEPPAAMEANGSRRAVFLLTSTRYARGVIGRSCIGHFPPDGRQHPRG